MNLENLLPGVVIAFVMAFLYAASKKKPKEDGLGNRILQLPKFYPIFGILTIIGGLGLLIYAVLFANGNDSLIGAIFSFVVIIGGMYLFAKGYISYIKIADFGIVETTLFGKQKVIEWKEIQRVSFGKISLELKITSPDKSIRAHLHLVGFDELVAILEKKTGKSRSEMGIPGSL